MFKITAIVLSIAASSVTAVIPSDTPTPGAPASAGHAVQQVRQVPHENAQCRTAQRQIAIYSRALSRLDMASAQHRHKAAIYQHARQTERDWQEQHCRPLRQTAKDSHRSRTL
jgi:hypothetical protein